MDNGFWWYVGKAHTVYCSIFFFFFLLGNAKYSLMGVGKAKKDSYENVYR